MSIIEGYKYNGPTPDYKDVNHPPKAIITLLGVPVKQTIEADEHIIIIHPFVLSRLIDNCPGELLHQIFKDRPTEE